jgi:hypothetical protein
MTQPIKRILIGIALFFLGGFIIPSIVWFSIFFHLRMAAPQAKFIIPDVVEVLIEKPGKYYVWNNYRTVFEGRTYSTAEELPGGIEITLHQKENNRSLAFHGEYPPRLRPATVTKTRWGISSSMNPACMC